MTSGTSLTSRICYLSPKLLSVAGHRGNMFALMQRCVWRVPATTGGKARLAGRGTAWTSH
jgi:hypothetical protein